MNKNKKIITASIFGILIFAFISTVTFQTTKAIKKNSGDLIFQKKEMILLENKIKDLEEFGKKYKDNKEELEKTDKLFIEPENPVEFINFLNFLRRTATDSEVAINVSAPSQKNAEASQPWPFITFQISGSGKFINLMKFLEKMENSPYLIEISGLSLTVISRTEKKFSPDEISANLFLRAFTQ